MCFSLETFQKLSVSRKKRNIRQGTQGKVCGSMAMLTRLCENGMLDQPLMPKMFYDGNT